MSEEERIELSPQEGKTGRTLQMNDYIQANEKILQVLRKDYHLENDVKKEE